jgi:hypothetical protein
MKSKKYHTVGTIPKSNIKIVARGKIDTPNTHKNMTTFLAWYRHFNKKWQVKIVLWVQTPSCE